MQISTLAIVSLFKFQSDICKSLLPVVLKNSAVSPAFKNYILNKNFKNDLWLKMFTNIQAFDCEMYSLRRVKMNDHSPFVIHLYPLKTVDLTVKSLYICKHF